MAKLYGHTNRLSQSFAATYAAIVLACIVFAAFAIVSYVQSGSWRVLLALIPLLLILYLVYRKAGRSLSNYLQGMKGESTVSQILARELPDTFSVYRGVVISYLQGDIDCIVLGPTGLFAVEVKSHAGNVAFNGVELTRNGQLFNKNFLRQAKSEAIVLRDYLAKNLHQDIFVKAVLVFSSQHARVRVNGGSALGIYVTTAQDLPYVITSQPVYQFRVSVGSIEERLRALSVL